MMLVSDQPRDSRAEADLRWYWNWSDGDLGLHSSFPAMVARIECGGRTGGAPITDIDERCLEAATRARRIARALELVTERQRRVLFAAFGPGAYLLPGLGRATPVAPLTPAAQQAHLASGSSRSLGEWLVRLCWRLAQADPKAAGAVDHVTIRAIESQAEAMLRDAAGAFASAQCITRRKAA